MAQTDYKICKYSDGTGSLAYVHTLCGVPPKSTYYPGSKSYWKADGTQYYDGSERATWRFSAMPKAGVSALRDICSGASAEVYIITLTDDYTTGAETFKTFSALMHWPLDAHESRTKLGYYEDLVIEFTHLEAVT